MPLPLKPGENIYIDHKIKEASYLSALLKKHYGITPTQIKRNSNSGNLT